VEVVFSDGTIESADVVGEDLHSDLAVVEVVAYPEGVQPIPLGSITDVLVGQTVVAIGNPFGLGGTLTEGIVSALGRTIPALTPFSIPESIQTDAAINPGNSGGPLLNLRGQVIGVNAQIETTGFDRSNSGVGFAIPVSIIERVVPELIEDGEYEWAWLGVIGGNLSPTLAEVMNLPVEHGAYISQIANDGPAERAGLRGTDDSTIFNSRTLDIGGDVITAVDGQPVGSFGELLIYIALKVTPGQDVTLTVLRDGEYQDIVVTMRERPNSLDSSFQLPTP
jgi:S1-C subfamily serine protease